MVLLSSANSPFRILADFVCESFPSSVTVIAQSPAYSILN
jgi:hypothetical protein